MRETAPAVALPATGGPADHAATYLHREGAKDAKSLAVRRILRTLRAFAVFA
jgi:hypothetical protein